MLKAREKQDRIADGSIVENEKGIFAYWYGRWYRLKHRPYPTGECPVTGSGCAGRGWVSRYSNTNDLEWCKGQGHVVEVKDPTSDEAA